MTRIMSIATGDSPYCFGIEQTARVLDRQIERMGLKPELYSRILRNTRIETRHVSLAEEKILDPLTAKERNDRYIELCLPLAEQVAREAIAKAGLTPKDIHSIISVSCTGWMLPSVDAFLINRMEMSPNTRRTPITELGCAAGAVGLARAWEQGVVYPDQNILLLSVELPSLTFQPDDVRPMQLVSSLIFADGAAGVVLSRRSERPGPRLLGSRSYTMPGTIEDMGYDLENDGLHIILTEKVPYLIKNTLAAQLDGLLAQHGATRADLKWCAMHPAGPKVLYLVEEELGLRREQLQWSWKVLRERGNMSSATVLFVLAEMLENPPAKPGDLGVIVAFGPGVSGELVLARWEE